MNIFLITLTLLLSANVNAQLPQALRPLMSKSIELNTVEFNAIETSTAEFVNYTATGPESERIMALGQEIISVIDAGLVELQKANPKQIKAIHHLMEYVENDHQRYMKPYSFVVKGTKNSKTLYATHDTVFKAAELWLKDLSYQCANDTFTYQVATDAQAELYLSYRLTVNLSGAITLCKSDGMEERCLSEHLKEERVIYTDSLTTITGVVDFNGFEDESFIHFYSDTAKERNILNNLDKTDIEVP
ncbi:hypothetical protein [Moritella viscosa]|uniref:Probable insertion sequence transposase protein n=1 Tax=Moritella viscosa TaxID=80854 RepID=A0A1L0C426_9GAMM|nr:hypothetical protein [Moritella viscosa]SGZ08501.1 Probable insertion sequence transposase protein [Moritella viscosa]